MNNELYISVDIEASGPYPPDYSMLSLGACVVSRPEFTFYMELKPLNNNYVQQALDVCKLDFERLKTTGQKPENVMMEFAFWLEQVAVREHPIFCGFGAAFDWQFVNYYFLKYLKVNPFRSGALDMKAYAMGKFNRSWYHSRKKSLRQFIETKQRHTHNALDDAIEQAELFRQIQSHKLSIPVAIVG